MNEYEYLYSAGIRQIDAHAALKKTNMDANVVYLFYERCFVEKCFKIILETVNSWSSSEM